MMRTTASKTVRHLHPSTSCIHHLSIRHSSTKQSTRRVTPSSEIYWRDYSPFDVTPDDLPEVTRYPYITQKELMNYTSPPTSVSMISRDFIHDSLYNPSYGYFEKQVSIFDPGDDWGGFDYGRVRGEREFEKAVAKRFGAYELEAGKGMGRQVWHTPVEIFKPHYAQAIARFIVDKYKSSFPNKPLVVYEMGAGNGSFAVDFLAYLREKEPEIFRTVKYRTIEISDNLAGLQRARIERMGLNDRPPTRGKAKEVEKRVDVVQKSVLEWDTRVEEECFFLGFEVLDNFPHDEIRYAIPSGTPMQCNISITPAHQFLATYSRITEPLIKRYMATVASSSLLSSRSHRPYPINLPPFVQRLYQHVPFAANMSQPEFIPTGMYRFLEILRDYFPNHRLLLADFAKGELPGSIQGVLGPRVQTRFEGDTVNCSTYLVQQGFFDIFFPVDFTQLQELHAVLGISWKEGERLEILSHGKFLERWGDVERTECRDGSNPMLDWYANAKFIYTP
ncbi:DUF185-domain-containing protein [Atractiella rhizophila]|nr:DUF185-domain-containing protein [Atractiella rhizophila]